MMPAKARTMTRTMATSTDFGFTSWGTPEVAWTVEYPLEVMDEIRAYACNELLQLSHGGAEVAGVMFGSQRPGVIRILTWRPISSEYVDGEMLRLSHRDRMNLAVQLEVARANPELKDLRPVGWFVSHPNGSVAMTSSDLEVHAGFFPESGQVTLVLRPTEGGRAEAGFFVRETDGSVRAEASYQTFVLEPAVPGPPAQAAAPQAPAPQAPAPPAPAAPAIAPQALAPQALGPQAQPAAGGIRESAPRETGASPAPRGVPRSLPRPSVPGPSFSGPSFAGPSFSSPSFAGPSVAGPSFTAPRISPPNPAVPNFNIEEPLPTRERWLWAIPIALALGLAAWSLYHRQKPAEVSPMAFHISSSTAGTVQLEWDPNSRAIRDSDHGDMNITDGGGTSQVSFTSDQLHAGRMNYVPKSGDVGFELTVYPASGPSVHESARLIAPASSSGTPSPGTPSADRPAAGRSSAATQPPELLRGGDDDAAQRRVRDLTEELRKERARNGELQNLVRILENRLGIKPEEPQP
jgi:proteasome lid subunit RPN8/RPN11